MFNVDILYTVDKAVQHSLQCDLIDLSWLENALVWVYLVNLVDVLNCMYKHLGSSIDAIGVAGTVQDTCTLQMPCIEIIP